MKRNLLVNLLLLAAFVTEASANAVDEVQTSIAKLDEQSNYSWKATTVQPEGSRFRRGPTEGKTEKAGLTFVKSTFGSRTSQVVIQGEKAAVTDRDGNWQLVSLRPEAARSGRFTDSMARGVKTPVIEAAALLSSTQTLAKQGFNYTGQLQEEATKARLSFRRRNGDASIQDANGTVTFSIRDGILTQYEVRVQGTLLFGDNRTPVDRTTQVEVFDVGRTLIDIPDEASKTLLQPLPEPLSPEVARAILERNGKRNARVHDPSSIVKCKDEYWLFATGNGVESWRSKDLDTWKQGPRVFADMPPWVTDVVPTQRGHFWAPDVIQLDGRYLLYYSVSRFGVNTSAIALASNATLDPADPRYKWTDHGIVIESDRADDFNAIDPAVIKTDDDGYWMSFGSFWSGIKMIELDPATGKRIAPDSPIQSLAHYRAIEAPHIYRKGDFYYLFVNWDRCCRGVDSTYNIRVGRSRKITGPYLDKEGIDLLDDGGTLLLETDEPFIGPGHANVFAEEGRYWFSCHYYDGTQRGRSMLAIRPLRWSEDGWPVLDPVVNSPNANEASDASPVRILTDIPYKPAAETAYERERCKLDLYVPTQRKGFSTLVWFHGGGLRNGHKADDIAVGLAKRFSSEGVAVASVNYRLSPKVSFPAYIEDAAAAVSFVRKRIGRYGGSEELLFVSGHSAGGYLTSLAE